MTAIAVAVFLSGCTAHTRGYVAVMPGANDAAVAQALFRCREQTKMSPTLIDVAAREQQFIQGCMADYGYRQQ